MGFRLYASKDTERLGDRLVEDISVAQHGLDTFEPINIVTQTEGMGVWLSTRIAQSTGISANVRFLTPQSLLEKLHMHLKGQGPDPLSGKSIVWVLYQLLGEAEFTARPEHSHVVHYMGNDGLKRLGLAAKLADLFDQYQIYRHEMVEGWNNPDAPVYDFQQYLWRKLKERLGVALSDKALLRTSLFDAIGQVVEKRHTESLGSFRHVYFFGLSVFTPYHMDIFESLAAISSIRFYMLNPAASDYWYEDLPEAVVEKWRVLRPGREPVPGNNLLVSWGRIIRDTFRMFLERDGLVNHYVSLDDEDHRSRHKGEDMAPTTKLKALQRQIMFNETGKARIFHEGHVSDDTIQVHACYTPMREVEALYNYLAGLFEKDNTLTGRDVLVTCDIDHYAPYIRAVFDTGPLKFRYTISDATYAQGDNPLKAFAAIMKLGESDFNAEEVVHLLDFTCIRERFGIKDPGLIQDLVKKALFRFGIEGRKEDESNIFSMSSALKRIIYGIGMRTEGVYDDLLPLDLVEGHDSDQAVRFCIFADQLMQVIALRGRDRSLEEWVRYGEEVMQRFLFDEESEDEDQVMFQELLNRELGHFNSASAFVDESVPYRLFSKSLTEAVSKERRMRRFHSQGITFCSHVPMRSIPFRVVCMMGMDHDKFPRQDAPMSFSHIDGKRLGDRSVRSNDKHLFLESLMSAGSHFFLSYIGSHVKDNSHIPPSVLVDELVSHIVERSEQPEEMRKSLIVRHPLHSFSHRYNQEGSGLTSYLIDERPQVIPLNDGDAAVPIPLRSIDLMDLCSFFGNPFKHHYNKDLKVYYESIDEMLPVSEPFAFDDSLQKSRMRAQIVKGGFSDEEIRVRKLTGEVPPANAGPALLEIERDELRMVRDEYLRLKNDCSEIREERVCLPIAEDLVVEGTVKEIFCGKLIVVQPSKTNTVIHKLIPLAIRYLAMRAIGQEAEAHFVMKASGGRSKTITMKPIEAQDALSIMKKLTELYVSYRGKMMPFLPDIVKEWEVMNAAVVGGDGLEKFKTKLREWIEDKHEDSDSDFEGGYKDPYEADAYERGFFDQDSRIDELSRNSLALFGIFIPRLFETSSKQKQRTDHA